MVQNINQFQQAPSKGDLDLGVLSDNVVSVKVDDNSAELLPGDAVKVLDTNSAIPTVTAIAAAADTSYGFITRNTKDNNYVGGDRLELAITGTAIYLEAGGAISRDAEVEVSADGSQVVVSGGTNPVIGKTYDKASGAGDLIRVIVKTV